MDFFRAIIVGLVQGLTEFLPVSSSGHLVLAQHLLGVESPGITFEVFLHLGTFVSVLWVFRRRISEIIKGLLSFLALKKIDQFKGAENRWFAMLLVVGTIPTALIGFLLAERVEAAFADPSFVGYTLLITGVILFVADRLPGGVKDINKTSFLDVIIIGIAQGLAVFPGISRSGSTISAALFRKLDKRTAAEYSFLLSLPAIGGAAVLDFVGIIRNSAVSHNWGLYIVGAIAAGISGVLAIELFIRLLVRNRLSYFAVYCWLVGITAIVFL